MSAANRLTMGCLRDARICMKKAWHHRRGQVEKEMSSADRLVSEQANRFRDEVLRDFEGKGLHMVDRFADNALAAALTYDLIGQKNVSLVANAVLDNGVMSGVCDLIERNKSTSQEGGDRWDLIAIRASKMKKTAKTSEHLAFLWHIAETSGLKVAGAHIISSNPSFRLGSNLRDEETRIWLRTDVSEEARELCAENKDFVRYTEARTKVDETPVATPSSHCSNCPLFLECVGEGVEYPIWNLPRISSHRLLQILGEEGKDIRQISDVNLTENQRRHWECVQKGDIVVDRKTFQKEMNKIEGPPFYYLDFEHVSTAVPIFDDVKPFEAAITQFSVHRCDVSPLPLVTPNKDFETREPGIFHTEYLSDGSLGSLKHLCDELLSAVGTHGSVLVYSGSEGVQLSKLALRFPELADDLLKLKDRLFDLERVIRSSIAHPEFQGKSSLKSVLPALVPQFAGHYDSLFLSNGADAVLAFERMVNGGTGAFERDHLRQALLEYCRIDTLGLIALHRRLEEFRS